MLTAQDNELACRVGPGTPMGELMRRHWIPAAKASELVADGEPVRLMLLGEKLVAFRDTQGRVGIMDHECPHRCASLFYGRNEEGGLRCIYHGWKFDVEGNCLDMANVPPHQDFKDKIHAKAYKVVERGGVIWTYMGPGKAPELPAIAANLLPEDDVRITLFQRECNWLQGLEGDIDTSHAEFLHGGARQATDFEPDDPRRFGTLTRAPEYEVMETDWGTMYGAIRPADKGQKYWRVAHFLFPFWTITPNDPFYQRVGMRAWVPMDDEHTMSFGISKYNPNPRQIVASQRIGLPTPGTEYLPNTTDWYGRWRWTVNIRNDHLIDREIQRKVNYSGILGVGQQDQAITESMGPIENRTKEHLAPSDRMIQVTRRRLIDAAIKLRDENAVPATVERPSVYSEVQGGFFLAPEDRHLWEAYQEQFTAFKELQKQAAQ
jgi:phthalate 4,5-dioxygenase oxygenase subunit